MSELIELKNLLLGNKNCSYILELHDVTHKPVGALYLSTIRKLKTENDIVITETNSTEKYFLYYHGIGIYFTYFNKLVVENTV